MLGNGIKAVFLFLIRSGLSAEEDGAALKDDLLHFRKDLALLFLAGCHGGIVRLKLSLVLLILIVLHDTVDDQRDHSKEEEQSAKAKLDRVGRYGLLRRGDRQIFCLLCLIRRLVLYKLGIHGVLGLARHGDLIAVDGEKLPPECLIMRNECLGRKTRRIHDFGFS